jgi:hypothetical protein
VKTTTSTHSEIIKRKKVLVDGEKHEKECTQGEERMKMLEEKREE